MDFLREALDVLGEVADAVSVFLVGAILVAASFGVLGSGLYYILKRRHGAFRLGQELSVLWLYMTLIGYPSIHCLMMLTKTIDKKRAWWSSNEACKNPVHRHAWNAAGDTRCLEAANYNRWSLMVWSADIWGRGPSGLFMGINLSELWVLFLHQNFGVQTVTVIVFLVIPVLGSAWWIKNVIWSKKQEPQYTIEGNKVCWKTPGGKTLCAFLQQDGPSNDTTKPELAIGPSE